MEITEAGKAKVNTLEFALEIRGYIKMFSDEPKQLIDGFINCKVALTLAGQRDEIEDLMACDAERVKETLRFSQNHDVEIQEATSQVGKHLMLDDAETHYKEGDGTGPVQ